MPANAARPTSLPPGPRGPMPWQTIGMITRQRPYLERQRRKYGPLFTMGVSGFPRLVVVADPVLAKQVFTADPKALHAGSRSPLRTVLGDHSLLGIDEERHLAQRRQLLPPYKGQRMQAYEATIEAIAIDEIDRFAEGAPFAVAGAMQRITLRAILRAVFGATGREFDELEQLLPPWTTLASRLAPIPQLRKDLGPWSPWGKLLALRARVDAILDRLIAQAKADPALTERPDVLALLVQATHEDGAPMTNAEIRDQLITMLAAGHETTAHQLSWCVERLTRHPDALARLVAEVDAGTGKAYRDATIREAQRARPTIPFAGRHTLAPYELGGYVLPADTQIGLCSAITHFDPRLFPEPDRFLPERFLDRLPETYSWIPFGGGIRRCIGATFAHMEMDVVLRVLLQRVTLLATDAPDERWSFRGVAMAPALGGQVTVRRRRARDRAPEPAVLLAA
ncbi:MAG: cytochrome [Solirubrobacterales bacterium]|nr:cytochrome [Solirubrobacterales bacterium]